MQPRTISKLVLLEGTEPGLEYDLEQEEVVIGREPGVALQIDSASVSRRHARLFMQGEQYILEDLGSSNGTYVNEERLTGRRMLQGGDVIRLGLAARMQFQGAPPLTPSPPNPAPARPANGPATRVAGTELEQDLAPPQLVVEITGEEKITYTLEKEQIRLGRADDNDIVIPARIISRYHARLERRGGEYVLVALPEAANPVFVDGRPVRVEYVLQPGDRLRVGGQDAGLLVSLTYLASGGVRQAARPIQFGERSTITLGRDPDNDVVLDAPTISRYHAQIERIGQRYRVRDLRSSNGTFVNDQRTEGEVWLTPQDTLRIGPYRFSMGGGQLVQYDESSGLRVEAVGLNKWVRKDLNILKDISLSFQPREFVVVVGQSGGGKSTLVDAIAGYRPATHGRVLVNGIDIYKNFDAIRNDIGFVPQKDIIHMELTVYQALDYAARLRMPADTTKAERHQRVMETLADLDLEHRKDVQISGLSGGQQKRVSIGVELLTKPGLFFLDEPTSGLDPGTETALMQLMRRLADQGRTIVLITHATKNVMLADKVAFLARGGYLAWFGPPDEALAYFDQFRSERERRARAMEFDDIYAILDDSSKGSAEEWAQRYLAHRAYQQYIAQPLHSSGLLAGGSISPPALPGPPALQGPPAGAPAAAALALPASRAGSRVSALRQFFILSARNLRILTRDRFSLFLMLAASPLVSMLDVVLALVLGRTPFDFNNGNFMHVTLTLFLLTMYGVMVGGVAQMREFVKENDIYKRERLVNLKVLPYVMSKVWVAGLLALYQALTYVVIHYLAFQMPGGPLEFGLMYLTLALATMAGMMLGLFASALAPNANAAPLIVILLMLPQIVLSGALIPLPGYISAPTSTRWAFEGLMSISGVGSSVMADACWELPEDLRAAMSVDDKTNQGCLCMGINALRGACQFPGLGRFYEPVLDQPPPVGPAALGDPPAEPEIPAPPVEPENQADNVALALYLDALKAYQAEVENIQEDYKRQVESYQAQATIFQAEALSFQQQMATYQIARNAAAGKAEGLIYQFNKDMRWAFVDRSNPAAYWGKLLTSWAAQMTIILALLAGIVVLVKLRDRS